MDINKFIFCSLSIVFPFIFHCPPFAPYLAACSFPCPCSPLSPLLSWSVSFPYPLAAFVLPFMFFIILVLSCMGITTFVFGVILYLLSSPSSFMREREACLTGCHWAVYQVYLLLILFVHQTSCSVTWPPGLPSPASSWTFPLGCPLASNKYLLPRCTWYPLLLHKTKVFLPLFLL